MAIPPLFAALLILGCGACHAAKADSMAPASPAPDSGDRNTPVIKVIILGSGTPVPSRTQAGTTILVEAGGELFLFDCGRGCTTRLAQYDPQLLTRIDKLFLTHLHSDHSVGIPDLWLNGWTQGRTAPLRIWGPAGSDTMMKGLRAAYAADIGYRLPPGSGDPAALTPETHILVQGGAIYDRGGVKITAFRVRHASIPAYGYRIDYAGKSVLLSGDTGETPSLARHGKGADLALIEVASPSMVEYVRRSFPPEEAARILDLHLTVDQASETLAKIGPRLGVYYHTVSHCAADKALIAATRTHYQGPLAISRDLMEIEVTQEAIRTRMPESVESCERP